MKGNKEESKSDQVRHLLHDCNKYLFFHVGKGAQQNKAIKFLKDGPISQKELQEKLGVQPASVSELISKLEGKGLVERSRNEADRRVVMLSLTKDGCRLADELSDTVISDELFSSLNEDEKDQLIILLERVHQGFMDREPHKEEKDNQ